MMRGYSTMTSLLPDTKDRRIKELEQRITDLESRAGVPRPCPRCGDEVWPHHDSFDCWVVRCANHPKCEYETSWHDVMDDLWREHEQNCREAEEDER